MRIAYICADTGVPVFGRKGSSIHVQEILRALLKQGVCIDLFATRLGGDPQPDLQAVSIHRLSALPKTEIAAREQAALAANQELRVALEREGPFDLVYERYSLWSYAGMDYARAHQTPGLLEVNAPLIEEQARYRGLVDRAGAEDVARRVFGTATALLAVSEEIVKYLQPYAGERAHCVANGVNTDRFPDNLRLLRAVNDQAFTIGFVGTLKPWHGLSVLVDAFALLHERDCMTHLLIVGGGVERADIERQLRAYGVRGAAQITGTVSPDEIPSLLARMDVAVAPYPRLANFYFSPLKVYEYMAAGVPVVASRIGQLDGLIAHGINGLLCPPGEAEALAEALDQLRREPGARSRFAKAARATIFEKHTWAAVVQRILQFAKVAPPPLCGCAAAVS
jgi:glycosyltransferase involved in cell wall biosynthesis